MKSFNYPKELQRVFDKLFSNNIKAIIVGGFVRDYFLNIKSKDIDIELYGIDNLEALTQLLEEFGTTNSVGKSFGVCKLSYLDYDLDFSLPRRDSKVERGHRGFKIVVDTTLDFPTAAKRRDFTMNAIGYDLSTNEILDPFHGIEDLQKSILRAVDLEQFDEDPLRFLRAVVFSVRFDLTIEQQLFNKLQTMMQQHALNELPRERIFEEIKKLFLKTEKPSRGFYLLEELGAFAFFNEFQCLTQVQKKQIFQSLDNAVKYTHDVTDEEKLTLMLALVTVKFTLTQQESFLNKLTNNKKMLRDIKKITAIEFDLHNQTSYNIYKLAQNIDIWFYLRYLKARCNKKEMPKIESLKSKAKALGVFREKLKPFIIGKDLILLGKKPSAQFSKILNEIYEKQMQGEVKSKEEAIYYLKHSSYF